MTTEIKTYSRARTAKAALVKLLEMHETPAEIVTAEVTEGRFTAKAIFAAPIMGELETDLIEQGFEYSAPVAESEVEDMEGRAEAEAAAARVGRTYINENSAIAGATRMVWVIADGMPGAARKDVIEACRHQGIAYGTARTQYQKWFTAQKGKAE